MPPTLLKLALLLSVIPLLDDSGLSLVESHAISRFDGTESSGEEMVAPSQEKRDTNACFRFSGQSAVVNGTLYLYGGQLATEQGQEQNTWTNAFFNLDLTTSWPISKPPLTQLDTPSEAPAVALGYLWSSRTSLFLYGGQFSWKPDRQPTPFSTWEYDIPQKKWIEHQNPTLSEGNGTTSDLAAVQRSSEGAGANVPSLGRGFYFGGHLDHYTTPGWSKSIARVYLQSLLEFTFPGYSNNQVRALANGRQAGTDGNYRNITQGGLQQSGGFTARADGLLIYVPGFGDQGILVALAGGTNTTFTQMNVVDIFDIATTSWYKQSTSGAYPKVRVNPCAVVAAAPDGSSYNIYMYGGQNLQPYGNQTQLQDMWILTIPSFTWIAVDQTDQSVPYGRSGHLCHIWDGQLVMIGGYTGTELSCESPGIYTYDLSNLKWTQQFSAPDRGNSGKSNPFSQQQAQLYNDSNPGGLDGSYGYQVPSAVASVVGGGPTGGATLTTPVVSATDGPMASGRAVTYTVTDASGAVRTETPNSNSNSNGGGSSSSSGPNIGAIVAGVIAGLLFLLVCYLLFCTYIYRKRVHLFQRHAEMAQQQARGEKVPAPAAAGLLAADRSDTSSDKRPGRRGMTFWTTGDDHESRHASGHVQNDSSGGSGAGSAYGVPRRSGSSQDLLDGHEPTFVGVMLHPRRSLRVINRD